jgi:uncharacterized protein with HEPN domain
MEQADVIRLQHMRDAAAEALQFAAGKMRADLDHDRMLILAILKDLEIIGEAAGRVSRETKQRNPTVPWDEIVGMRNRLIHGYFDVNLDVVWETISHDLPQLLADIDAVLDAPDREAGVH